MILCIIIIIIIMVNLDYILLYSSSLLFRVVHVVVVFLKPMSYFLETMYLLKE